MYITQPLLYTGHVRAGINKKQIVNSAVRCLVADRLK